MANGISLDNNLNQNNLIIEQFSTPKSAVQRLDETKANYVKSDNVLINDLNRTKSIELINKINFNNDNKLDNLIISDLENSAIRTNSQVNNQLNTSIQTDKIQSNNNNNNNFKNFNQQLKSKEDCLLSSLLNCEYNKPLTSIILSNNLNKKFNSNQSNQFLINNQKINSPIKYRKHVNKDNIKTNNQINLETQLIKLICIDNEEELPNFSSSLPSSSNSERLSNCSRPSSICSSPISSSLITKKNPSILNKPLPKPPIQNSKDAIKLQKKSTNKSILSTSFQTVNSKLPSIVSKTSKAILSTKFTSPLKVYSKVNSKVCSKLNSVNSKLSKSTSCLRISSSPPPPKELNNNNLTQQITKSSTELNTESIQATKIQLNQNNKITNNNDFTINSKLTSQNNDKELNTIKNVLSFNENIDLKQPVLIEKVENQQSNLPITPVINRNLKDKINEKFLEPKKDVPILASITKNESKTTNQLNNLDKNVINQIIQNNDSEFKNEMDVKTDLQSSLNCCFKNNNLKDHELRICLNCSKIEKEFKNLKIQPICLNKTSSALKEELKNLNNQINQFINEQKTIELDNLKQSIPVSRSKSDVSHRLNRMINQTKFNEPDMQRVFNTIGLDNSLIYKLNLNHHHQQQMQQNQYLINNLSTSNTNLYNSAICKPTYQTNYQMTVNHLNQNSNQPYLSNSQLYCNQSTVDSYYTLDSSNAPKQQQQLMYTAEFINGKNDYWINDKQNDFKHQFTIDNSKINRLELNNNNKQSIQTSFKNEKSSLVNQQKNQLNNLQNTTNLITNLSDPNLTIQFNSINLTDTATNKFNNNIKLINQHKQNSNNLITKPLLPENDLETGEISIIERNARVIKWLYQNKKYYNNSV